MRISEIFYSIQGEGVYAGLPMAFVRFQGCPFRCAWCDSQHTWEFTGGKDLTAGEILKRVDAWSCRRVCVTGGEPLAHLRDFKALVSALKSDGYWIEVETAGGHRLPQDIEVDSWVIDVKCPGSKMDRFNKYDQLLVLRPQDQLKFVISSREDFDFATDVLAKHRPACHVLFSPAWGSLDPAELAEWVKCETPQARLSLQIHKQVWGPDLQGV